MAIFWKYFTLPLMNLNSNLPLNGQLIFYLISYSIKCMFFLFYVSNTMVGFVEGVLRLFDVFDDGLLS